MYIFFESTDEIFCEFDNYEIWPCVLLDLTNPNGCEVYVDFNGMDDPDIAFWSVYGHFKIGGLECLSDHETYEEAKEYMETLPSMSRTPITPF
jgi:hypothetical protein